MRTRLLPLALLSAAVLAGCGSSSSSATSSSSTSTQSATTNSASAVSAQTGFEGAPIEQGQDIAPASTTGTATVDGIQCGSTEQLAYHIHAHLAAFFNGQSRALPGGIGIPGSQVVPSQQGPVANGGQCIYWLHTHAPDGVIHIESPTQRIYTLGNFFDIWQQPLSANQVGTLKGKVTAYLNGKLWTKDPRSLPLVPHAVVQLDVGSATPSFQSFSWSGLQL
jgi:hypothetical protein